MGKVFEGFGSIALNQKLLKGNDSPLALVAGMVRIDL
jgi:hypothetical protein